MVEEVVLAGRAAVVTVVEDDVVGAFTVVEVAAGAEVDVVVGLAVVDVVARAQRLRTAAAAGSDVPTVAMPTVIDRAASTIAPNAT
jgi:hypothetical protein